MSPPQLSLDQLQVLLGIVEHGSFSAAARATRRAQGAVSYHVKRLEEELGLELFDRSGHRPSLTVAGRAIVAHARQVLGDVDALCATAGELREGVEGELVLGVDILFPTSAMALLLSAFEARFPTVRLTLRAGTYRAPIDDLLEGRVDLAIAPKALAPAECRVRDCLTVPFVAVVAPSHPLASLEGPLSVEELERHRQLVVVAAGAVPVGRVAPRTVWRLSDGAMRHGLLLDGVGWSRVPRPLVRRDLDDGRLVELVVEDALVIPDQLLAVMHPARRGLGPAARWLVDRAAGLSTSRSARRDGG